MQGAISRPTPERAALSSRVSRRGHRPWSVQHSVEQLRAIGDDRPYGPQAGEPPAAPGRDEDNMTYARPAATSAKASHMVRPVTSGPRWPGTRRALGFLSAGRRPCPRNRLSGGARAPASSAGCAARRLAEVDATARRWHGSSGEVHRAAVEIDVRGTSAGPHPRRCVYVAARPLVRPPGPVTAGRSRQRATDYALDVGERKVNHRLGTSGEVPPERVVP
jgi:hypothetical protein